MRSEQEILKDGENPEIRKMQYQETKMRKTRISQKLVPLKMDKKKKVIKKQTKLGTQPLKTKALHELVKRRVIAALSNGLQD